MMSPFGESRGGTPEGELPQKGRAAPAGAEVVEQRLPAFRFPFLSSGEGKKREDEFLALPPAGEKF